MMQSEDTDWRDLRAWVVVLGIAWACGATMGVVALARLLSGRYVTEAPIGPLPGWAVLVLVIISCLTGVVVLGRELARQARRLRSLHRD